MKYPDYLKKIAVQFPFILRVMETLGIKRDFEIKTFFQQIKQGDIVLDVGANVGRFTKIFCMLVGEKGKVFAFEPVSMNYQRLLKLSFGNLTCFKMAMSDQIGQTTLYFPPVDGAQASLVKQSFGNWKESPTIGEEICEMETLDSMIGKGKIPIPQFIKIDAEGAELAILKGGAQLLKTNSIKLFMELNAETMKSFAVTPQAIWAIVQSYGYSAFILVGQTGTRTIKSEVELLKALELYFSPCLLCLK
jgi:FkbM family methyltransferase